MGAGDGNGRGDRLLTCPTDCFARPQGQHPMIGLTGGNAAKQNLHFLPQAHAGDAQKTSDNLPINIHDALLMM